MIATIPIWKILIIIEACCGDGLTNKNLASFPHPIIRLEMFTRHGFGHNWHSSQKEDKNMASENVELPDGYAGKARLLQEFLDHQPHPTPDEIRDFARMNNIAITMCGASPDDPNEPGYDKFTYSEQDVRDMGWFLDPLEESMDESAE